MNYYVVTIFLGVLSIFVASQVDAAITSPTPTSTLSGSTVSFTWSAIPGAEKYALDVGTMVGGFDIWQGIIVTTSKSISTLPLNGSTVYVRLWTRVGGVWQTPLDYTYTAADHRATLTTPAPTTTFSGSTVTFSWSTGTSANDYALDVGTTVGGFNISQGIVTGTSMTVSNLPINGTVVYVSLWTRIGGVWQTPLDYTYTAADPRAKLTIPGLGATLSGSTIMFSWDAGAGASNYWLDVGTTLDGNSLSQGVTSKTSKTVSGLPINGSTVYVKLYTQIGGTWQAPIYYTFTSKWGILSIVPSGGGVQITFVSIAGRFYQLQVTDNFADPSLPWRPSGDRIPGKDGATQINVPVTAGVTRRFWRMALLPDL